MRNKMNKNVLVLFSGGIDSTSCIHFYQKLDYNVMGLFVNYGQPAANRERIAVEELSKFLGINTIKIRSDMSPNINDGLIQGRNLLLFATSLSSFPYTKGIISMGIHSGTIYPDCSPDFVELTQRMLNLYTNGNIIFDCPFLDWSKKEIYKYLSQTGIPFELTYSCELGGEKPCGKCLTCKDIIRIQNEYKK